MTGIRLVIKRILGILTLLSLTSSELFIFRIVVVFEALAVIFLEIHISRGLPLHVGLAHVTCCLVIAVAWHRVLGLTVLVREASWIVWHHHRVKSLVWHSLHVWIHSVVLLVKWHLARHLGHVAHGILLRRIATSTVLPRHCLLLVEWLVHLVLRLLLRWYFAISLSLVTW